MFYVLNMSLLIDKYNPKSFNDFIINKKIAKKLKIYSKGGTFLNKIIVGGTSVGKYTLAMGLLNEYFGPDVYKKKSVEYKLKIGTNTKEFNITQSSYHFEIFINNYLFNNRVSLIKLLNIIAENKNIKTNSYNIILIKNVEDVPNSIIPCLKNIMETNIDTCRFIFISKNISKFRKIKSMLFVIRVPKVSYDDIKEFLDYNKIKYNKEYLHDNNFNLTKLLLSIELKTLTKRNYKYSIDIELDKFIKILNKKDINEATKLREHIYNYISKNLCKTLIFNHVCNYYIKSDLDDNVKLKIVETSSKFQNRLVNSYREIIHIEAYLITILNLLINN